MSSNLFDEYWSEQEVGPSGEIVETESIESMQQPSQDIQQQEQASKNLFEKYWDQKETQESGLWNSVIDLAMSPDDTPFEEGLGQAIRAVGTTIGGMAGDTIQMVKGMSDYLSEKFPVPEMFKSEPSFVQKIGKEALLKVPTSEDLIEKFDAATDGEFIPGSGAEEFIQEVGSDITALMMPFTKGKNPFNSVSRKVGAAVGANLAKEGVKELGFEEKTQSYTKMGSMLLLSMYNPGGAKRYVQNIYKNANEILPENAAISSVNMEKSLLKLDKRLSSGLKDIQSKKPILSAMKDLERNIEKGQIKISDITEAKRNLNELRAEKVFDPEIKGRNVRKNLKSNFSDLGKVLDDAVLEYGSKNPEFVSLYKEAQAGWGGIEQSKKASNFIERTSKNIKFKSALGLHSLISAFPGSSAATAGVAYSGLKSYELMHRVFANKTLSKYYQNVVTSSLKENTPELIKNLKKLDEALYDEEKSNHQLSS